ncbi:uncharacterized protein F5891DRAFT_163918 [Suillus fuscotomentosus]|uniref:Uncharacterized protein n=1 Tax=Suillus fuscotomentosus TaxID=1912939 RepID=A0AAD4ECL0_9AGAM|nr:uncharacterized protein F5891DRAFT_163918 [Suillus fuscotomentosus]KAG1902478.1 hypothetical protein F5891DRAFT_163918 [Suillus fuscotomentosus]
MTHFSNVQPTRQKGSVPPDAIIRPLVERYAASGYSNSEIISRLRTHKETSNFKISLSLLKSAAHNGDLSLPVVKHTVKSIGPAIGHVRQRFPKQGSHDVKQTLLQEEQLMVPRTFILQYMNVHRAIIVPMSGDPHHVPLPSIALADMKILKDRFSRAIRDSSRMNPGESRTDLIVLLQIIWDRIMLPIIDVLEHVLKPKRPSRIWLCPTAAFTSIPLHAAHPFQTKADRSGKEPCLEDGR